MGRLVLYCEEIDKLPEGIPWDTRIKGCKLKFDTTAGEDIVMSRGEVGPIFEPIEKVLVKEKVG